jgi:hypothetical protein
VTQTYKSLACHGKLNFLLLQFMCAIRTLSQEMDGCIRIFVEESCSSNAFAHFGRDVLGALVDLKPARDKSIQIKQTCRRCCVQR